GLGGARRALHGSSPALLDRWARGRAEAGARREAAPPGGAHVGTRGGGGGGPRRGGRMSLRVVGAGLGRTGTMSLKLALERLLGAPCYHMLEVFKNPEHIPVWHAA